MRTSSTSSKLSRFLSIAAACLLALASSAPSARAQPSTGSISGRVHNEATGQYLNNARVTVKGTDLTAFTDETGTFRIGGVPAGSAVVEAFYSGLDPLAVTVPVAAGQNTARDINLTKGGSTVKLDAYVLSASKLTEGESLATNEQRFAANMKNVVATDAFGDVTEGNVAEFMKFLPGVTVEYSDASPNAVAIRGFDPNMTAVTVDGSSMANASGSAANRNFLFTQVSINNTSRIEVTKVPTPANPADGISGTVNMISKSAFERSRAQFNYRAFISASSDGMQLSGQPFPWDRKVHRVNPGFDFDYTLPITKNFGIVFTGLSSKQWNEQNISSMTWNTNAAGTGATTAKPYLQSHTINDAPKWYERHSTSLKADWRITPNSVLSIGGQATYYIDKNGAVSRTVNAGTNATPSVAGGTALSFDEDTTVGATGRGNFLHIDARTLGTNARYRFDNGTWKIDTGVHGSTSKIWRRYEQKGNFQALNLGLVNPAVRITFDGITPERPTIIRAFDNNNREVDLNDINNYRLNAANAATSTDYRDHKDNVYGADMNIKRRLNLLEIPSSIQIGGLYKVQDRSRRSTTNQWNYNPPDGNFSAAPFLSQIYRNRPNYFGFDNLPWVSSTAAVDAWKKNPNLFVMTPAQVVAAATAQIVGSEWLRESATGIYSQVEARLFKNRLTVLTGVRYEKTHDMGMGPLNDPSAVWVRDPDGSFAHVGTTTARIRRPEAGLPGTIEELRLIRQERANFASRSYDGYYPSLHLTFNATQNFLLRAAYAKTYGRPDFTNIVPNATITENDIEFSSDPNAVPGDINVRNTGLKPWTANNYDLSAEYYTENGGLITGGVFRKDITDFFGTVQVPRASAEIIEELGLDERYVGWRLNTTINSGEARVSGIELNVRQSLAPLGKYGRYFSVFANATKLKLEGNRTADFNRFLPKSANWGFTFTKNPITFMAKWHHRGEQNRGPSTGLGPLAFAYQDARTTLDVNLSYQAFKRLSVFVNARNVTNVHFNASRYQFDTPEYARRQSSNSYGAQWAFGMKGTF